MTSVARELDGEVELGAFATTVRDSFGELYGRSPVEVGVGELADRVPGVGALAGSAPALR
jgi:hypothetical protein